MLVLIERDRQIMVNELENYGILTSFPLHID